MIMGGDTGGVAKGAIVELNIDPTPNCCHVTMDCAVGIEMSASPLY